MRTAGACAIAFLIASSAADARQAVVPPSSCPSDDQAVQADGRIACVRSDTVPIRELVERAAPILWFSPDEQLLVRAGIGSDTPSHLPFDTAGPASQGVVYFGLTKIHVNAHGKGTALSAGTLDLRNIEKLEIQFYFYYPRDAGFGGHPHDLEQLSVTLDVRHDTPSCRHSLYYRRAEGWAHGSQWYHNILAVETDGSQSDFSFPMTVLVEEGKHAVVPDRNGDGHYTPGYDVNRRINDAWGVRDTLRSGDLAAPRYSASDTKPRDLTERSGPDLILVIPECIYSAYRRDGVNGRPAARYALRAAPDASRCQASKNHLFDLCDAMRERRVGKDPKEVTDPVGPLAWLLGLQTPADRVLDRFSVGYRLDGSSQMWTFVYPFLAVEVPKVGGWIVPKFSGTLPSASHPKATADLNYARSISRWIDWYSAAGVSLPAKRALGFEGGDTTRGEMELGIRFRFNYGGGFNGFRVGTRWSGFGRIENQRMLFEATLGRGEASSWPRRTPRRARRAGSPV